MRSDYNIDGMVPALSWKQKWPKWGGRRDKRLYLAVEVATKYARAGRGKTHDQTAVVVTMFFWADGCKASWRSVRES